MPLAHEAETLRRHALALAGKLAWADVLALLAEHLQAVRAQPELLNLRAEAFLRIGHAREARAWLEEMGPGLDHSGDRAAIRRAANLLGVACFELGDLDDAQTAFERALQLGQRDGDDLLVARATNSLGAIANIRGEREMALGLYHVAIPVCQRIGSAQGLAECYHNMAISYRDLGDLDLAEECDLRALEFARECANGRLVALAQLGRAELSLRAGDPALAEAGARRAAEAFVRLPDPVRQSDALRLAGVSALALGRVDDARAALDTAIDVAHTYGGALNEAEALRARAELEAASGRPSAAITDARAAAEIFTRMNARAELVNLARWLESLEARQA